MFNLICAAEETRIFLPLTVVKINVTKNVVVYHNKCFSLQSSESILTLIRRLLSKISLSHEPKIGVVLNRAMILNFHIGKVGSSCYLVRYSFAQKLK